jgi:hypothetical protein
MFPPSQMIFLLIPALILETFSSYFFFKVTTFNLDVGLWIIIDAILWDMFLVVPPNLAIFLCASTAHTAENLKIHLEKYSNICEENFEAHKVNFLLNKLQNRKVIFSSGFFNINLHLGLSMVSVVTTYMVIICQFEGQVASKLN